MNIWKVTGCILAGLITASCNVKKPKLPVEKAQKMASRYLKADEFAKIKNDAPKIIDSISSSETNQRIFYWDSILAYNKFMEGIDSGRAYILDSVAGKPVKYPEFKIEAKADKRSADEVIKDMKKEISKYYTSEEMADIIAKEPKLNSSQNHSLENNLTHYYGQIAAKSYEKRGFEFGVEGQRYKELEK